LQIVCNTYNHHHHGGGGGGGGGVVTPYVLQIYLKYFLAPKYLMIFILKL
jgi:hypothetical protein